VRHPLKLCRYLATVQRKAATRVASPASLTLALAFLWTVARYRQSFSGCRTPSPLRLLGLGGRSALALALAAAAATAGAVDAGLGPSCSLAPPSQAIKLVFDARTQTLAAAAATLSDQKFQKRNPVGAGNAGALASPGSDQAEPEGEGASGGGDFGFPLGKSALGGGCAGLVVALGESLGMGAGPREEAGLWRRSKGREAKQSGGDAMADRIVPGLVRTWKGSTVSGTCGTVQPRLSCQ